MTSLPKPEVRRRQVFYIPGFDPSPPRRYRELYRNEAALQAEFSGHDISILPGQPGPGYRWQVAAHIEGYSVQTQVEVLVWSDIVQGSMGQGIATTYWQLLHTSWIYIRSGALARLMRLRKGPIVAALYPIAVLLGELLLAAFAGALAAFGLAMATGLSPAAFLPAAALVLWAVLWNFRRLDGRIFAWYLMHDYAFSAAQGGAYPAPLEERLAAFRQSISQALQGPFDEVLVVGHSSGAHLAISVLVDLERAGRVPGHGPVLSLLTLGQVVPMVSFLPKADRLRADLAYLSQSNRLTWVDVSAPGDGCSFALCDPVAVSGQSGPDKRWPLVLSAAFSRTLSPARFAWLRRRYFRLHFQYLCAFDRLNGRTDEYDYFAVTAGPRTLGHRFAHRNPSKSRIERAENPYGSHP